MLFLRKSPHEQHEKRAGFTFYSSGIACSCFCRVLLHLLLSRQKTNRYRKAGTFVLEDTPVYVALRDEYKKQFEKEPAYATSVVDGENDYVGRVAHYCILLVPAYKKCKGIVP